MANAQIVFEGDSRTLEEDNIWPSLVYSYIEPRFGLTLGYNNNVSTMGGIAEIESRSAALDATIIPDVANILVLLIGVNDRLSAAATIHSDLSSYCTDRQTAGWYVALCTEIIGTSDGWDTTYLEYNTLIRANWESYADRLIDLGANPLLSSWSLDYYKDTLHPNEAGNRVIASVVIPEIVGGTPAVISLNLELEALGLFIDGTE